MGIPQIESGVNPSYAPVERHRSWFDRALLSMVEGLTTNGIYVVMICVTLNNLA